MIIKSWAVEYFWRAMSMTSVRWVKADGRVIGSGLGDSVG